MTTPVARSARRLMACAVAAVAQIVTLLATSALSTPPAVAADMTVPPPPVVARPLWSGFYIGLQGGWGGGSTRITDPTMSITFQQLSYMTSGPLYGAQMGADWQFGNFVVGGELEAAAATIKGNSAFDPVFPLSGVATKFRTLATGTGRAGYAFGNFLAYGKFGVAWADIELTYNLFSIRPTVLDHSRTGIVGGAGLEWMLIANLSARLEYDFIYLGAASMNLGGRAPQFLGPQIVDHTLHLVKAGLNFRFGGGDYLAARY
jgi:outer membrane immunogenic protein